MSTPPFRGTRLVLLLGMLALAGGCRIGVAGELEVERDGTGTAAVEVDLDPEALARLDELGVDPTAELSAAAGRAPDWRVERGTDDEGTLTLRLERAAEDPQALTDAFRSLVAGLSEEDPALLVDLDLRVGPDGATALTGTVGFRPPATAGAVRDGRPIGPDAEELAALVADAVRSRLVVRLPGAVGQHDADTQAGRTLTWQIPVGDERPVSASAAAPRLLEPWGVAVVGALAAVGVAGLVWWWTRRRRRA